jgi:uncharacterized protein YdcH (DUF465 family)
MLSHPPRLQPQRFNLAWQSQQGEILMGLTQDELKAHLMETNDEFRRLVVQHSEYGKKLETLTSRHYLTPEEQVEEVRLKKVKLRLKDQMEGILNRYRGEQQVA